MYKLTHNQRWVYPVSAPRHYNYNYRAWGCFPWALKLTAKRISGIAKKLLVNHFLAQETPFTSQDCSSVLVCQCALVNKVKTSFALESCGVLSGAAVSVTMQKRSFQEPKFLLWSFPCWRKKHGTTTSNSWRGLLVASLCPLMNRAWIWRLVYRR